MQCVQKLFNKFLIRFIGSLLIKKIIVGKRTEADTQRDAHQSFKIGFCYATHSTLDKCESIDSIEEKNGRRQDHLNVKKETTS